MKKKKTEFVCSACGAKYHKWQGRCSECGEWNQIVEQIIAPKPDRRALWIESDDSGPLLLDEVEINQTEREETGFVELDRVLGGGIVPGSLVLFGGEPGIGKSTLLLQLSLKLANKISFLYVSGEESASQLKSRARRLGFDKQPVKLLIESRLEKIFPVIENEKPAVVMVDSIQTLFSSELESAPGSVAQIRNSAAMFLKFAKKNRTAFFIVGHITKEGAIAGPKALEHIVDTVVYFEGDRYQSFRIIRAVKNRFGAVGEIGVFQMCEKGLIEINNPSRIFLSGQDSGHSGTVVSAGVEGTRSFLMEIQALVAKSNFGYAQRVVSGYDSKRLSLIIAVLEKKIKLPLGVNDIYINLPGGLKVKEPGLDFAIAMAICSSFYDQSLDMYDIYLGELALTGEIRPASQLDARLKEADRLGFKRAFVSDYAELSYKPRSIRIIRLKDIRSAVEKGFQ